MASNIKFKRSAVQNRVPTTSQLALGELALNTYDGKLYTEINTGSAAVVEIGSKLSSLVVDGANGAGGGDVVFHGTTAGRDLTWDYSDNSLKFADNTKAKFGTGSDLSIYHDSGNSFIDDTGTGDLNISGSIVRLQDSNRLTYARGVEGGAFELYHNNLLRVTTTADGADIGGTGSLKIPVGTTAQRSGSPTNGDLRYNTTTGGFEGYSSGGWGELGGGGVGIGSTSINPQSGLVGGRIGVGFTDINIVGTGVSVTGYGTTIVIDFNDFKPGSFHRSIHNYTATAGQTTFAGLNYVASEKQIAVYLNGARLSEATYTATSGTTVVLDVGASLDDEVEIINIHTNSDVDRKVNTYTATAGQTTFTGLSYNSKQELDVYLNGIRLASDDFTATSGSTVVLAVGASVNDVVDIVSTGDGVSFRSTTDASGDRFTLTNVGIGTDQTPDKLNVRGNVNVVGVLTATTLHGDGSNLTNTGSTLSEPSSGTQRLVTTSLTTGTMTSSGTGSELAFDYANNHLEFTDNTKAVFGTGEDLSIYHDGNHSYIEDTGTGNLLIKSDSVISIRGTTVAIKSADNSQTLIKGVQNAGSELYYNGNLKFVTTNTGATISGTLISDGLTLGDNEKLLIGNNTDIEIFHNGTNSIIQSDTGDLQINAGNSAGNVEINVNNSVNNNTRETSAKFIKNGAVELYHDNTKRFETTSTGASITGNLAVSGVLTYDDVTNVDSVGIVTARQGVRVTADGSSSSNYISVGAGSDLKLYHDGTNSYIKSSTGELRFNSDSYTFNNAANNANAFTINAGGSTNFFHNGTRKAYTASTGFVFEDEIRLADNIKAEFGSSQDLKLYHSGSHAILNNITGSFQVQDAGAEKFRVSGTGTFFKDDITLSNDNDKLNIGAGNDLQLYHDGTDSHITNTTGGLIIEETGGYFRVKADDIKLEAANGEDFLECDANGAVKLYHDDTQKFQTASHGATISGKLKIDGSSQYPLVINGSNNGKIALQGSTDPLIRWQESSTNKAYIQWNSGSGFLGLYNQEDASSLRVKDTIDFSTDGSTYHTVWHAGNDGTGSGLDADTLDGVQGSSFLRSDATDTASGALTFTSGSLEFSGHWFNRFYSGTTNYIHLYPNGHSGNATITNIRAWTGTGSDVFQITGGSATGLKWRGNTIWTAENDGTGSGLDADTLDGVQATGFVSTGGNSSNAMTGNLRLDISSTADGELGQAFSGYFGLKHRDQTYGSEYMIISADAHTYISATSGNNVYIRGGGNSSTNQMIVSTTATTIGGNTVWHAGSDGAGSGLDADTLDGVQGSSYVRSDADDTIAATLTTRRVSVQSGYDIRIASGGWTGNITTPKIQGHNDTLYVCGGANGIIFRENDTDRWQVQGNGDFYPSQHSTYDIGANGQRVKHLYVDEVTVTGTVATAGVSLSNGAGAVTVSANGDIRLANGNWTGNAAGKIQHHNNSLYIQGGSGTYGIMLRDHGGTDRWAILNSGDLYPMADSTYDIGTSSVRVANGYFDTLYGDGSNLTGITAITINTNTSGNLLAASGSANSINGQSGLRAHGNAYFHSNNDNGGISFGTAGAGSFGTTPTIARAGQNNYHMSGSGQGDLCIGAEFQDDIRFGTSTGTSGALTTRLIIQAGGDILPGSNSSQDLGNSSTRWNNIYSADLQLSNESKKDTGGNDVDGTWGDWTLQEGESDVFMINNRSGKKFRIKMEEVS